MGNPFTRSAADKIVQQVDKNKVVKSQTAEQEATEQKAFDGYVSRFQNRVTEEADKFKQERVGISNKQSYYYPMDIADGADTGLPFIRFGINTADNTEKLAIFLYQPPGFTVADGANYANFDVGSIRGGINAVKAITGAYKGSGSGITRADVGAFAMMGKDKLMGGSSTIDKITSSAAIKTGIATNPYTRTAYESTNVRTFSFSFKLIAESPKESQMAKNIERSFRKFLYPKRAGSIALVYPPLFDIEFYSNSAINPYMPRIKPCYLTSCETTFNEASTAFHAGTGAPMEVSISLGFQEERVLVRQDLYATDDDINEVESGYYNPATNEIVGGGTTGEKETESAPSGGSA